MFSFAGDTVLDPFAGTGATAAAAIRAGRHSISNELEPKYFRITEERVRAEAACPRLVGATHATVTLDAR